MDKKIDLQMQVYFLVGESGFEPLKHEAADLQSAPFDRLGNPPWLLVEAVASTGNLAI